MPQDDTRWMAAAAEILSVAAAVLFALVRGL